MEIGPYWRWVTELVPFNEEQVLVARFRCRSTGRTFSMLPVQLVPYHKYTVASILLVLLLAAVASDEGLGLCATAEKRLTQNTGITGGLIHCWLLMVTTGLRRAHHLLARWARLGDILSGETDFGRLREIRAYCRALRIRGPPRLEQMFGLDRALVRHARATNRFLFGVPSQERRGTCAS